MILPQLLAPAGGEKQMEAAVRFGADAVYLGLTEGSLRARCANFSLAALKDAVAYCHGHAVRVLLTLNIFAYDEDVEALARCALEAANLGVDGVILADPGVLGRVHALAPALPIHLSTQANTMNAAAARFWYEQGVRRIVLSRELSLERIRAMRRDVPADLELEAFVHGAVCMSYSGRCALSKYLAGRDANRGDCAQPCRWRYALVEEKRPGQYFPMGESENGTEILSAGDLNMMNHLSALIEAGVSALKIEGRMKSEYYVATVVGAYRRALDAYRRSPALLAPDGGLLRELNEELEKVSHRPYDTGFYFGAPERMGDGTLSQTMELVGKVLSCAVETRLATVEVRGKLAVGDALELLTPEGVFPFALAEMTREDGERLSQCAQPLARVRLVLPAPAAPGALLRGPCRNH